jgi:phosphate-selective porin
MKKGVWVHVLLLGAMLCPAAVAVAAAKEPSMNDLLIKIETLQNRVDQLESEKADKAAAPAATDPALVDRVDAMEEKLTKVSASTAPKPEDMRVYWKDGLRFDSNDGAFKLKLGGRLHLDFYGGDESDDLETVLGDTQAGEMFRRAYLSLSGIVYNDFEFMAEYDFAGGAANFRDVYLGMNNIPVVGQLKIGHFKEPFSLEELTSDNNMTFIERSIMNAFSPSRNTGVQRGSD